MKIKPIILVQSTVIVSLLGVMYAPTFAWMWKRWNSAEGYFSHGPIIIVAALFFAWIKKEKLKAIKIAPASWGIGLIAGALVLHFCGLLVKFYFASAVSIIMLVAGVILYVYGLQMMKMLLFPVGYLFFMIPFPLVLISNLVLKMKLFAAYMSTIVLNKIGIIAVQDGSVIKTVHSFLEVEAPCSGLRSLIALVAFGVAFAYLSNHSRMKKWVLVIMTLPIALFSNVLRIVLLGWVSEVYGQSAAHGWIHDFSGFLLFAVAALLLLATSSLLNSEQRKAESD